MSLLPIDEDLVSELRERLRGALQEDGKDRYCARDIERVQNDDYYLWRFIVHQHHNIQDAKNNVLECLHWRKEFGVNDIQAKEFPQIIDDIGAMYECNKDKEGNRLIIMHVRRYRKEPIIAKLIRRYFAFRMEQLEQDDDKHPISIIFDMAGAGLTNVDMDFLWFMFSCFKIYYPCGVEHIFVYDMPWIFTAMWKIVKSWMNPGAVKKIKFVNKKNIQEHVDADQLLEEFGGVAQQQREFPFDYLILEHCKK